MKEQLLLWITLLFVPFCSAQESCFPFLLQPCDGVAQDMECIRVTTELTNDQGGESAQIHQELCFGLDSPLFGGSFNEDLGFLIEGDAGAMNLDSLAEGDTIGQVLFDATISSLAGVRDRGPCDCVSPLLWGAILQEDAGGLPCAEAVSRALRCRRGCGPPC